VTNTLYPPIIHVASNKLRITRNQIEGQVNLGSVDFSNKIEQSFANTDPLKVRQNPQWQVTATNCLPGWRLTFLRTFCMKYVGSLRHLSEKTLIA
jgi:hypothetical protein